jgi:hypothetical protein
MPKSKKKINSTTEVSKGSTLLSPYRQGIGLPDYQFKAKPALSDIIRILANIEDSVSGDGYCEAEAIIKDSKILSKLILNHLFNHIDQKDHLFSSTFVETLPSAFEQFQKPEFWMEPDLSDLLRQLAYIEDAAKLGKYDKNENKIQDGEDFAHLLVAYLYFNVDNTVGDFIHLFSSLFVETTQNEFSLKDGRSPD